MKKSIRLRLIFFLGAMLIVAWAGIAASSIYSARKEVQELFDAHLSQSARFLQALIKHEIEDLSLETHANPVFVIDLSGQEHFYEGKITFQVKSKDGATWFMSENAPQLNLSNHVSGFLDISDASGQWRVFILRDKEYGSVLHLPLPAAA